MKKYPNLFSPIKVGNLTLKNRIIAAPTSLADLTPEGYLTNENIAYYELKAKGGAAVVTLGEAIVHSKTGKSHHVQICLDDTLSLSSLAKTAQALKRHNAIPSIELSHGGKYGGISSIGGENKTGRVPYGPSHEVSQDGIEIFEMPEELIDEIIESYGKAAALVKHAGFQMLLIHAGHGWLFSQFLSPTINKRTDQYGGSFRNRARFLLSALDSIRKGVGSGFPIEVRISGDDFLEGGCTLDDAIQLAQLMESKINIIHVSAGNHEDLSAFVKTHPSMFLERGCNVYLAEAIKKAVRIPVACVGSLSHPEQMEEIISSGKADIVELARALLADPYLPKKALHGKTDDIRPCLRCFTCLDSNVQKKMLTCAVNPIVGSEFEHILSKPLSNKAKKVLVVGGGPAGMQAATEVATNEHQVVLCEKTSSLGGALKFAENIPFKKDLWEFKNYLEHKLRASGAGIMLNTEATADFVQSQSPDVLIIAIGASPIIPGIPGIDGDNVIFANTIHERMNNIGDNVIILGGGLVGCEEAINLGMKGKKVAIIEKLDQVASDANIFHKVALLEELAKYAEAYTRTEGKEITKEGIVCLDSEGNEKFFKADTIICSVGVRSLAADADNLRRLVNESYVIGDCNIPNNVHDAVASGYYIARDI